MDKQISLRISNELAKSIKDFNEQNPDTPLIISVICRAAIGSMLKKAVRQEVLVLEVVQEPREDKAPGT